MYKKTTKNNKKQQKTTKTTKYVNLCHKNYKKNLFIFLFYEMKNTYFDSKQQGNHKKHLISQ